MEGYVLGYFLTGTSNFLASPLVAWQLVPKVCLLLKDKSKEMPVAMEQRAHFTTLTMIYTPGPTPNPSTSHCSCVNVFPWLHLIDQDTSGCCDWTCSHSVASFGTFWKTIWLYHKIKDVYSLWDSVAFATWDNNRMTVKAKTLYSMLRWLALATMS